MASNVEGRASRQVKVQGYADALAVYLDRRVLSVLFLGFSSGLPLMLVLSTLTAWLNEAGVSKSTIGLFAFVLAPYSLKFLWAPFVNRLPLPPFTSRFGQRRGWLLFTQILLMGAIFGLAQTDPAVDLYVTALWALAVAFCSASQDIVIDAYRIEILDESQLGAGSANVVTGYRMGMWVATAGALYLAAKFGWSIAYAAMALFVLVGVITVLLNPEPRRPEAEPEDVLPGQGMPIGLLLGIAGFVGGLTLLTIGDRYGWGAGLLWGLVAGGSFAGLGAVFARSSAMRESVVVPFADFIQRNGLRTALIILAFISLYKASDVLIARMANPFYLDTGFTKEQIAWVSGTFGFLITFLGSYIAGSLIYRAGIMTGLWIGALTQMLSNLMFALQAYVGADMALFHATILVENLAGGFGTTAFVAYLASLCNLRYTAVQYALLTSFMQLLGKFILSPSSGFMVDGLNVWAQGVLNIVPTEGEPTLWLAYVVFFVVSALVGIPALLLLRVLHRHNIKAPEASSVGAAPVAPGA